MTTKSEEEIIEKLAMAVTHSEQGEYAKNEQFVKDILQPFLKESNLRTLDRLEKEMPGESKEDKWLTEEQNMYYQEGFNALRQQILTSAKERGLIK